MPTTHRVDVTHDEWSDHDRLFTHAINIVLHPVIDLDGYGLGLTQDR